jgi:hypothetical protein
MSLEHAKKHHQQHIWDVHSQEKMQHIRMDPRYIRSPVSSPSITKPIHHQAGWLILSISLAGSQARGHGVLREPLDAYTVQPQVQSLSVVNSTVVSPELA